MDEHSPDERTAESLEAARSELLDLLCSDGIYRATPENPIVTASGAKASWMLDSMRVTLTARGSALAARCLLDRLSRFDVSAAQLATYGITAIPLVDACVAHAGDRFRGLIVRKEKKSWGSMKLIEGPVDPTLPVIIVDDSISSGSSMVRCVESLEEAGLRVLGAVCLVRFGWWGGTARMEAMGYQMEHVFSVHEHLVPRVDPERPRLPYNPTTIVPEFAFADELAPDGIHPASYAREVLSGVLHGTPVRRPPHSFDRDYDGAGGVWVSVRSRADIQNRHARNGSWVFPSEPPRDYRTELVHAAVRTAALIDDPSLVDSSAIAVTFFGALEEVTVGELDNDRYGIVVRSRERIERLGGALPRMPGMTREWRQFAHAHTRNGRLLPLEPCVLFRHTVDKAVEPGARWQPTGVPTDRTPTWLDDPERAGRIAARARQFVLAAGSGKEPDGEPLPDSLMDSCEAIFVTLFADGEVAGCVGAKVGTLETDLRTITEKALADTRFPDTDVKSASRLAVTVSFLTSPAPLGNVSPHVAAQLIRHGEDAVSVLQRQQGRAGLLLPFVAMQHGFSPRQFVDALVDKAGITRAPYVWGTFACTTWLAEDRAPRKLVWHLPPRDPPEDLGAGLERLIPLYLGYLRAHTRADGLREGGYRPLSNTLMDEAAAARQIHGGWALALAAAQRGDDELTALARLGHETCRERLSSPGLPPDLIEDAFLLLTSIALGEVSDVERATATRLWNAVDPQGRIQWDTSQRKDAGHDARQDYEPPQVLLALAHATAAGITELDGDALDRGLRECMHRFRGRRRWGQVSWLPMALAAWYRVTKDAGHATRAFEIIDWALTHQQEKSGGFINAEHPDGPGYSTGVYLEGVAAALELAVAVGDTARARRYRDAATRAVRFLDLITYQERDRSMLADPDRAIGGVRLSLVAGDVRTDFVQHALIALVALAPHAGSRD